MRKAINELLQEYDTTYKHDELLQRYDLTVEELAKLQRSQGGEYDAIISAFKCGFMQGQRYEKNRAKRAG